MLWYLDKTDDDVIICCDDDDVIICCDDDDVDDVDYTIYITILIVTCTALGICNLGTIIQDMT